jgi:tetratricopeptide (TPR) repeat protein
VVLSVIAVVAFIGVGALTRAYHDEESGLAERWATRATTDAQRGNLSGSAFAYRAALRYAPESYEYAIGLARALVALKRTNQAEPYLLSLWDQYPEDGATNLELARVYVAKEQANLAIRYYHNAIYGIWRSNPDVERREARKELVAFLLKRGMQEQAQAEVIAMAAGLPDDPGLHLAVGNLFLEVQEYQRALQQFQATLQQDPKSHLALAGAGRAAFELGHFAEAQTSLQNAVAANPQDNESASLLQTAELVQTMDPYIRSQNLNQRVKSAQVAFATAGKRLDSCPPGSNATIEELRARWTELNHNLNGAQLAQNVELLDQAMSLAFRIEQETAAVCGAPSREDQALLIVAAQRGGRQP